MKSRAIVTLADSNYFDLLLELIASIKRFKQSEDIAICVLDAGLKEDQIQILKDKVEIIKKPNPHYATQYMQPTEGKCPPTGIGNQAAAHQWSYDHNKYEGQYKARGNRQSKVTEDIWHVTLLMRCRVLRDRTT